MRAEHATPPQVVAELRRRQAELAARVEERPLPGDPALIAALDVHLAGVRGLAAAVSMRYPELTLVEQQVAEVDITFPYIPGLLSFREAPACLEALGRLGARPELLLVDGQGRAHPRRFGLACHVGLEAGLPTIGVAKSILVGRHGPLADERGSAAVLEHRGELVGMAVRTRASVVPLYVSVGHLITLPEAVDWVLRLVTRYRLPEPSRLAHRLASDAARALRERD